MGNNRYITDNNEDGVEERLPFLRRKVVQRELKDNLIKEKMEKIQAEKMKNKTL